jgi:hypothetical protein
VALTDNEMRQMIPHVEYEVIMLLGAAEELDERDRDDVMRLEIDDPRRMARTAFLEVFLFHARALDEFLGKKRGRSDDLWAGDYVETWAERSVVPMYRDDDHSVGPLHSAVRTRINKQLAHVTTKRMDKENFPLASIARDIHLALGEFVRSEAIRDKPEFDRLRALSNDHEKWMIRILSGGS